MQSQLYIPKKIKAGYQNRPDTYTKKLAYIIYYDDVGVLRKEKSWESWREKTIDPQEFDNVPQSNFSINKDIKRYNWGHFSSKRTLIRVYDPRGMEFEITTENLIGVLMNSDCSKRQLSGEFVYAWYGPELVLLPTNCEEYISATNYTSLQGKSIGVKDLVPGCSYKTKKQDDLVYVGKFNWYEINYYRNKPRTPKKYFIFMDENPEYGTGFELKSTLNFLAIKNSDSIVLNYASIIDKFKSQIKSSKIIDFESVPCEVSIKLAESKNTDYYGASLERNTYFKIKDGVIYQYIISLDKKYDHSIEGGQNYTINGYLVSESYKFDVKTQTFLQNPHTSNSSYYYNHNQKEKVYSETELKSLDLCDLYVNLENGIKQKLISLDYI